MSVLGKREALRGFAGEVPETVRQGTSCISSTWVGSLDAVLPTIPMWVNPAE